MAALARGGAVIPVRASSIRPRATARTSARPVFGAGLKRVSIVHNVRVKAGEAAAGTSAGERLKPQTSVLYDYWFCFVFELIAPKS